MPKTATKGRGRASAQAPRYRFVRECAGIAMVALALLSGLALLSFEPSDPVFSSQSVVNAAGRVGAALAAVLVGSLGLSAVVAIGVLAYLGTRLIVGGQTAKLAPRVWVGVALLMLALSVLPSLLVGLLPPRVGNFETGALGGFLVRYEMWLFGTWGSVLLNGLILVTGLMAVLGLSPARGLVAIGMAVGWFGASVLDLAARIGTVLIDAQVAARRGIRHLASGVRRGAQTVMVKREQRARRVRVAAARNPEPELGQASTVEIAAVGAGGEEPTSRRTPRGAEPVIVDHGEERKKGVQVRQETFTFNEKTRMGPYVHPEVSVFQRQATGARTYDRESLIMNSRILEKKLQDFGVGGQVDKVHPGPVITMYEFKPASGVKVNRIVSLSDDLALALRALSVRIIAPLPGKSVVGIEVANAERENVYIRDILECEEYRSDASKLMIALGKDIFGNPSFADLSRMPHLLVAGATGTGKSVFLNSLLCSILCRATPDDLKLLLVDPKLLELSIYEGIPHLIADVVTNPKRAAAALQGIVHKMEERYQMMSALGVRSIQQFNDRAEQELADGNKTFRLRAKPGEEEGEEVEFHRLPYIVVVIDELADLMVVSARDVEEALQRLAQMARAAGIHLILATQRPSVDVLTGVIKANFPARVSFQVSSRTDSRTILDQNGAETLLGQGDMLFLPPGTSKLQRVHGAFVTEDEVHTLVAHLREQGAPSFDEDLLRTEEESEAREGRDQEVDEMFDRAVAIVAETRNASISYVQRRLKVGYNRAARMVEQMEAEGIVGPQISNKPREVFARPPDP